MLGGGKARLTLNEDFIYGFVEEGGQTWYIEPLWYLDPNAAHGYFVVYPKTAAIHDENATCAAIETEQEMMNIDVESIQNDAATADFMACYEIDLAIASDHLMFDKYGSVSAVEDHNIGVINNVQDNYVGEFIHDLNCDRHPVCGYQRRQ